MYKRPPRCFATQHQQQGWRCHCESIAPQQFFGNVPAHAIGPYGAVYGEVRARKKAEGFTKGHAFAAARRAMIKALLHDVHRAWHGKPLDYLLKVEIPK